MTNLNGWQRLWIVLSLLFGLPVALLTYSVYSRGYFEVTLTADQYSQPSSELRNTLLEVARKKPDFGRCISSTIEANSSYPEGSYYFTCDNNNDYKLIHAIAFGLIPGLIFGLFGYAVAWIRRGFRDNKN